MAAQHAQQETVLPEQEEEGGRNRRKHLIKSPQLTEEANQRQYLPLLHDNLFANNERKAQRVLKAQSRDIVIKMRFLVDVEHREFDWLREDLD